MLVRPIIYFLCAFAFLLALAPFAMAFQDYPRLANQALDAARQDEHSHTQEGRLRAAENFQKAVNHWQQANQPLEVARVLNQLGQLQLKMGQVEQAMASHRKALLIIKQSPDLNIEVDTLNGLGESLCAANNTNECEQTIKAALSLSKEAHYLQGEAQALLLLSDNYSDYAQALKTAETSLLLWRQLEDKFGIAKTLTKIGQYQLTLSEHLAATRSYDEALNMWHSLNIVDQQARVLIGKGFIAYRTGAYQSAINYFTQATPLIDEAADPFRMGQINVTLGELFIDCGMPETALVKFKEALSSFRNVPRHDYKLSGVIVAFLRIGEAYYLLGNYPEAIANLQEASKTSTQESILSYLPFVNEDIGKVHFANARYAEALSYLQSAHKQYKNASTNLEAARVEALIGQLFQKQGQPEKARAFYLKALKTLDNLSDNVNQSAVLAALGHLELQEQNLNSAESYFQKSLSATENIRRISTNRDLTAAFSATVHERYEAYIDCLMRQGRQGEAFAQSELARARSLGESLRQGQMIPGLEPQLAARENELRQSLRVKQDAKVALLSREYKKEDLTALDGEIVRLEGEYAQVEADIRVRYPAYAQVAQPVAWELAKIQQEVVRDDETALLEYSLGEQRGYFWAVTRQGFASYELPEGAKIKAAAERLYKLLSETPTPEKQTELNQAAQELSQMILAPAAAQINGKRRLIIVADGALHYVPFQVLPAPGGSEPLLAQQMIVNAPSATILGLLAQETAQRQPAEKLVAAFGDPVFPSNLAQKQGAAAGGEQVAALQTFEGERLRHALRGVESDNFDPQKLPGLLYAGQEMANLRALSSGDNSTIASDFDATRDTLQQTNLRQYRILHFATHGLLNSKQPEFSGLVMSLVDRQGQPVNGFVTLSDIYNLRAPVDLVVLSACRTALGKDVRGEGLIGLTRGFMYAGASSVAASLWKVDDEATAELMRLFYANMLQKEMPPAQALRAAQNEIRQRPEWSAPYYWAAFTLQGEYRQVIKPANSWSRNAKTAAGVGALLALLTGAALWRRRKLKIVGH